MTAPVLELRDITKEYEGNRVLKRVSLAVRPGTIHALVGENGAGKSTLMNVLFGMPVIRETGGYGGEIVLEGKPVVFDSPAAAMAAGLGMVHQEFMLIPGFRIAENIKLNREPTRPNWLSRLAGPKLETLDLAAMRRDARAALDRVGLGADEWIPVAGLPVGHMQFVEIAREVDKRNARLLIFDEPTAVLAESEARTLLEVMRTLARDGLGILFITHRLDEVLAVADDITVLRDGEVVGRLDPARTTLGQLAELMVGRPAARVRHPEAARRGGEAPKLEVRDLEVRMPGEQVAGVSLTLEREDRRGVGILPDESIELNIAITAVETRDRFLGRGPLAPLRLLDRRAVRRHAREMIRALDIRCTGPRQQVRRLSGGNQQKVCLARAMTLEPDTLLVSEPTRGIDVGAKERVLEILRGLNRGRGISLLVTSSELAELRALCDRIAIVYRGRIHAILPPDASDERFGLAMAGELEGAGAAGG